MPALRPVLRILAALPIWLASAALFALMAMTFCDVVMRSSFDAPIEAATELTRILVAVAVFAVLPHVSVLGQHIAVDLTDRLFERYRLHRARDAAVHLLSAALLVWPTQRVLVLAERTRDYGDVTEYLAIPQHLVMWFIFAGLVLTILGMAVAGVLALVAPRVLDEALDEARG